MEKKKSNRSFMTLSQKDCLIVYKQILHNADNHYNNSLILAQNKSYGSAISFLILSMEESMKAFILYMDGNGFQFRHKVKGINNLFNNHQLRYPLALFLSILHVFIQDLRKIFIKMRNNPEEILEFENNEDRLKEVGLNYLENKFIMIISEIYWFANAELYRQDGFYVDYQDELKSPLSANEDQFNDVKKRLDSLIEFNKSFFGVLETNDHPGFQEQIKKIKNHFIEKDWYNKLGNAIENFNKSKGDYGFILSDLNDYLKRLRDPDEDEEDTE